MRVAGERDVPDGGLAEPMGTAFVGRGSELRQLGALLARAGEGSGSVVLLSGEAGIGKTRLCRELSHSCRQRRGGQVLLGRAVPEESALPYAALADALRVARRAEPAVWAAARARADILSAVAPELAGQPRAAGSGAAARPIVFEALLDAVEEAAGDRTTLWVLDDLHLADVSTWEFVRYAARRIADLGVVLAVTLRTEEIGQAHPRWPDLVRLSRESVVASLALHRLEPADSERLVRDVAPALPPAAVAEIVQRGAGTPLLLEELAVLAAADRGVLPVPDVAKAIVHERTRHLAPGARALLAAAAAAGPAADTALLSALLPEEDPRVLVQTGLMERNDGGFQFRHPLFREAVYDAIPAERRRALHEEIAAAVAKHDDYGAEWTAAHVAPADRPEAAVLSPREAEIAGLVAEGLTNPAIARRLFLSRPTVASHVAHILAKLGFSSRSQIAAWAAQRGQGQI